MSESPVFIVGCPRSGTALLRDLLRAHPSLAFPQESHFIPLFYRAYGNPKTDREARALAGRILSLCWVRRWDLPLQASALSHHRSFGGMLAALYREIARRDGKSRWGDKTPQYVTQIRTLLEIFPQAKVLHIFRDGRDVTLSLMRVGFGPQNLFAAASEWRRLVTAGRDAGAGLTHASFAEVRYETLVAAPEETMRSVCEFIQEPFVDDVLRPSFLPPDIRPRFLGPIRRGLSPQTEIVRSNVAAWKTEMTQSDRTLFESVAGDLLASLAYETEGLGRPFGVTEQLRWKIDDSSRQLLSRLNYRDEYRWMSTIFQMQEARIRARARTAFRRPRPFPPRSQ